jgi:hypothetical protein
MPSSSDFEPNACVLYMCICNRFRFDPFAAVAAAARTHTQIHWIEFREEANDISCVAVLPHAPEIWSMATTASQRDLLATSYTQGITAFNFLSLARALALERGQVGSSNQHGRLLFF